MIPWTSFILGAVVGWFVTITLVYLVLVSKK